MKVDIWSDVRCPFCYIGKRKFEAALAQFEHEDQIEVEWHSFELDPNAKTILDKSSHDYLAEKYGKSKEWAIDTHRHVEESAKAVGLDFNFDQVVIANSFDAHRLIQLAKVNDLDDAVEEALFIAHFTAGKNIADHEVLMKVGQSIGLEAIDIRIMLDGDSFTDEVREDEHIAETIGVRGVPFFVFDERLAVSGAQPPETFLGALNQAWEQRQV